MIVQELILTCMRACVRALNAAPIPLYNGLMIGLGLEFGLVWEVFSRGVRVHVKVICCCLLVVRPNEFPNASMCILSFVHRA